jgi:hypothetical protein
MKSSVTIVTRHIILILYYNLKSSIIKLVDLIDYSLHICLETRQSPILGSWAVVLVFSGSFVFLHDCYKVVATIPGIILRTRGKVEMLSCQFSLHHVLFGAKKLFPGNFQQSSQVYSGVDS